MALFTRLIPSFVWKILFVVAIVRLLPNIKHYEIVAKDFKNAAMKASGW